MKLLFLVVVLIGFFKPYSCSDQTTKVARTSEVDVTNVSEGIKSEEKPEVPTPPNGNVAVSTQNQRNCDLSKNLNLTLLSNGQQYYFGEMKGESNYSWYKVKEFCEQHGMAMVILDTDEEHRAVTSHNQKTGQYSYWVSATSTGNPDRISSRFYWTNGVRVGGVHAPPSNIAFSFVTYGQVKPVTCLHLLEMALVEWPCDRNAAAAVLCKRPANCK